MQKLLVGVAFMLGLILAWVDSRPSWDDAGVLVAAILLSSAILGALCPQQPWPGALAISLPMPLHSLWIAHRPPASAVALAIALAGAYVGSRIRRSAMPTK